MIDMTTSCAAALLQQYSILQAFCCTHKYVPCFGALNGFEIEIRVF